jgi:hypothetical protein
MGGKATYMHGETSAGGRETYCFGIQGGYGVMDFWQRQPGGYPGWTVWAENLVLLSTERRYGLAGGSGKQNGGGYWEEFRLFWGLKALTDHGSLKGHMDGICIYLYNLIYRV